MTERTYVHLCRTKASQFVLPLATYVLTELVPTQFESFWVSELHVDPFYLACHALEGTRNQDDRDRFSISFRFRSTCAAPGVRKSLCCQCERNACVETCPNPPDEFFLQFGHKKKTFGTNQMSALGNK